MSSDIELVCFDLGGVLVRAAPQGWGGSVKRAGLPLRKELERLRGDQNLADWNDRFETGELEPDKFIKMLSNVTTYSPEEIHKILEVWLVDLYPGVEEFLTRLADTGVRLACLSNTNPIHWNILWSSDVFKPLEKLNHRFASHVIGSRKPDLEAYEVVENEANVDPESILFFDDLKINVGAAIENYWNAERIDPKGDTVAEMTGLLEKYGVF